MKRNSRLPRKLKKACRQITIVWHDFDVNPSANVWEGWHVDASQLVEVEWKGALNKWKRKALLKVKADLKRMSNDLREEIANVIGFRI